jgi:hypothetical protein
MYVRVILNKTIRFCLISIIEYSLSEISLDHCLNPIHSHRFECLRTNEVRNFLLTFGYIIDICFMQVKNQVVLISNNDEQYVI